MSTQLGKIVPVERPQARTHKLEFETHTRVEFKDITAEIQKLVGASGVSHGLCHIFVTHTTAAVLINENDDPAFTKDLGDFLAHVVPRDKAYHHNDGNCDSHLKASLIGCEKSLMVEEGRLVLGTWQGIYLCEFDGPRRREMRVKIVSD